MLMVFGTIPIVGSKPQTNLSDTLKVVKDFLKAVCVVFFVPYSLCMPQYNNEDMNKKDVVVLPPTSGSCIYTTIWW